jgi:hypothetical protein
MAGEIRQLESIRLKELGATMDTPLLWHIPLSHYSENARWALDYKRIARLWNSD